MPNTLVITIGFAPPIVTETVYGLMTADPPWVPDRIVIVTTARCKALLMKGTDGVALCDNPGRSGKIAELFAERNHPLRFHDRRSPVARPRDLAGRKISRCEYL